MYVMRALNGVLVTLTHAGSIYRARLVWGERRLVGVEVCAKTHTHPNPMKDEHCGRGVCECTPQMWPNLVAPTSPPRAAVTYDGMGSAHTPRRSIQVEGVAS